MPPLPNVRLPHLKQGPLVAPSRRDSGTREQRGRGLADYSTCGGGTARYVSRMLIRPAGPDDTTAIWSIIEPTIRAGETYALDRDMTREEALAYWLASDKETFVAEDGDGQIVGTYYMRANQSGGGAHVCNCGYMTKANATGKGIARRMCEHSLEHARARGYRAMQFNFVVSTNERAVQLWQSLGFAVVGRLPLAFDHPVHGYVDALTMFQAVPSPQADVVKVR